MVFTNLEQNCFLSLWLLFFADFLPLLLIFYFHCKKFGWPYLGKAQQPQEQRYPFISVCANRFVCPMIWLPVYPITHADCNRSLTRRRVCNVSQVWESLAAPGTRIRISIALFSWTRGSNWKAQYWHGFELPIELLKIIKHTYNKFVFIMPMDCQLMLLKKGCVTISCIPFFPRRTVSSRNNPRIKSTVASSIVFDLGNFSVLLQCKIKLGTWNTLYFGNHKREMFWARFHSLMSCSFKQK